MDSIFGIVLFVLGWNSYSLIPSWTCLSKLDLCEEPNVSLLRPTKISSKGAEHSHKQNDKRHDARRPTQDIIDAIP